MNTGIYVRTYGNHTLSFIAPKPKCIVIILIKPCDTSSFKACQLYALNTENPVRQHMETAEAYF